MYYTCVDCNLIPKESSWYDYSIFEKCECQKNLIPFVSLDVLPQLCQVLTKDKFIQVKKNISKGKTNTSGIINNAMDGSIYQDFINGQSNKSCLTISLNINSDGAPLVNSKNISMWPLMASIIELNATSRQSFSNLIYLGNNSRYFYLFNSK